MKKKLIYLTEILFLIYIIIFNNVIVENFLRYLNIINVVFFGLLSLIAYLVVGFPRNNKLFNYNAIQTIFIGFIVYYFFIYVLGIFFGFVSNVYSLKFLNVLKNVVFVIGYYCFREMYRYMVIKQNDDKKRSSYVVITILFILLDIIMEVNGYELTANIGIFKFICSSIIPNVAINLLLSYLSYKFSFKVIFLFIMILKLSNYILPIFPNLGDYLNSILLIILLFYLYYQFSLLLEKYDRKISFRIRKKGNFSLIFVLGGMLLLVSVVSGVFKYHMFAIVSNSMIPEFSKGDGVLVEKLNDNELDKLEIGDIIAFYDTSGRMVVHRIVSIDENDGQYFVKTKGDNNESVDSWTINNDNIYGKVIFSIKYIGIPSVELSELMSR